MAAPRDDLDEQIRRNESTRGSFDDFASHRLHVMRLLVRAAAEFRDPPRLILLGAGNCNDVDLRHLLVAYDHILLVDWDADALSAGVARQLATAEPRITAHAPVDLREGNWSPPTNFSPTVVASLCLLSQLVDAAAQSAADRPDDRAKAIAAARRNHLQHLVELLPPGGVGVLVFDFLSSLTAPEVASADEKRLPALAVELLQKGNFFQGLHPGGLHRLLTADAWFAGRIRCHIPTSPWNWKLGNRVYAVSALVMRRTTAATGPLDA